MGSYFGLLFVAWAIWDSGKRIAKAIEASHDQ